MARITLASSAPSRPTNRAAADSLEEWEEVRSSRASTSTSSSRLSSLASLKEKTAVMGQRMTRLMSGNGKPKPGFAAKVPRSIAPESWELEEAEGPDDQDEGDDEDDQVQPLNRGYVSRWKNQGDDEHRNCPLMLRRPAMYETMYGHVKHEKQ